MPKILEAITTQPAVDIFRRIKRVGDDPTEWEFVAHAGIFVPNADRDGFYVLGAINIRSNSDTRRCYMDISTPERINDYAYFVDGSDLTYDCPRKFEGEFIPAVAIDGFGNYELFHSKISPDIGIDVLRRGLHGSPRKQFIAEDLGYILRDEGRHREAAEMFEIAVNEKVSSYFVYGELAGLYARLGDTRRQRKYHDLFKNRGQSID